MAVQSKRNLYPPAASTNPSSEVTRGHQKAPEVFRRYSEVFQKRSERRQKCVSGRQRASVKIALFSHKPLFLLAYSSKLKVKKAKLRWKIQKFGFCHFCHSFRHIHFLENRTYFNSLASVAGKVSATQPAGETASLPLARMCAPRAKMVPRPQGIFGGKLLYGCEIKFLCEILFLVKTPCARRVIPSGMVENNLDIDFADKL
jgi:hypothetical protein